MVFLEYVFAQKPMAQQNTMCFNCSWIGSSICQPNQQIQNLFFFVLYSWVGSTWSFSGLSVRTKVLQMKVEKNFSLTPFSVIYHFVFFLLGISVLNAPLTSGVDCWCSFRSCWSTFGGEQLCRPFLFHPFVCLYHIYIYAFRRHFYPKCLTEED